MPAGPATVPSLVLKVTTFREVESAWPHYASGKIICGKIVNSITISVQM